VLVGATCLVAVALAALYGRRAWRPVAGILIGIAAVAQGLEVVSTLRDGWVLAAIPAWLERTATGLALASGAALILVSLSVGLPARAEELDPDVLAHG
jgi:hypothetical protein